jgi:hypothetical protein
VRAVKNFTRAMPESQRMCSEIFDAINETHRVERHRPWVLGFHTGEPIAHQPLRSPQAEFENQPSP